MHAFPIQTVPARHFKMKLTIVDVRRAVTALVASLSVIYRTLVYGIGMVTGF